MTQIVPYNSGILTVNTDPGKFGIVEYEQAVNLLHQCLTIDDAKRFSTFADAKAAWAKVVHDQRALRLARALKLDAGRHLAELAKKERPIGKGQPAGAKRCGTRPGAKALLIDSGMSKAEAKGALKLASLSNTSFKRLTNLPRPPALSSVASGGHEWEVIGRAISLMGNAIERYPASEAFQILKRAPRLDTSVAKRKVLKIYEWCDDFIRRMDNFE